MTLEDFFTLTEMKDGLTAVARVKELLSVMQKEKDCAVKNVGEATRQWSTVASTIVATESKDCLDHFIQLDGLCFIDRWLKDAQKFGNDTGNSFVEESIVALLRALEKLQIDNERSVSSGIWMTVKNLLGHSSSTVQDKARALFDSWKQAQDNEAAPHDVKKVEVLRDDGHPDSSSVNISPSCRNDNEENSSEPSRDETLPVICSDAIQQVKGDDKPIQTSDISTGNLIKKHGPPDALNSSNMMNHIGGNLPVIEETTICHSEGTTKIGSCGGSAVTMHGTHKGQLDVSQVEEHNHEAKQAQEIKTPENVGMMEKSSTADVGNTLKSAMEPDPKEDTEAKDEDSCPKVPPFSELRKVTSQCDHGMEDSASPNHYRSTIVFEPQDQAGEFNTDTLQGSSGDERKWGEAENPKSSFSGIEDAGEVGKEKDHSGNEVDEDSGNDSVFFKPAMHAKDSSVMSKTSDIELDYGMVDPLEVARQVAIEVEREVDCREASCSSSEKISGLGIRRPNSPDSTNGKECQAIDGPNKEVPSGPNLSSKASPTGVEPIINAETLSAGRKNSTFDMAPSKISDSAQELVANTDKGYSGFDLNLEFSSEDTDRMVDTISTPISVVSASRAAAASGLPVAPLQFEGALGWKGSAATSAFRPIPENDKTISSSGGRSNSKPRLDHLDFDLNVTEGGEDTIVDLLPGKRIAGESSAEGSPRRSERMQLDLNRVSDGSADALSDLRREALLFQNKNGRQSPSRSSSSSSKHSLRNFDLNDQPHDISFEHPFLGKSIRNLNASGGVCSKQNKSVISLLGTRVEVKRRDFVPQTLPFPNGRIPDLALDTTLARTGSIFGVGPPVPYSPVYGYNGLAMGSAIPFSSGMYGPPGGPIPYMVDSRGAPVVPQIMGSIPAIPPGFSQPNPFMVSLAAATSSGSNGSGPSRHDFDLNSGLMIDRGNREGLRQLSSSSHGRSLDEHLRANSQQPPSSSSGAGVKRLEPDGGWEPYPFNLKHQQPPWK